MNKSNITITNIPDTGHLWTETATDIIEAYLIRIVGAIGVCFNIFLAVILLNKRLKHNIYNCRAVCSLSVSLLGLGFVRKCFVCENGNNWLAFYSFYISVITLRQCMLASLISDLFLISNRFLEIIKKKTFLSKMSKSLNLLVCFLFSVLISLPVYFSVEIVETKTNQFEKQLTEFGTSKLYSAYLLFVLFIESILPILFLSTLNVVSVLKFKRLMAKKGHLTKNRTEGKLAEIRFTKMVLILTTICLLSRAMDFAVSSIYRLTIIEDSIFSPTSIRLLLFLMSLIHLFLFSVQALDGLVYVMMDMNLWRLILVTFKLKKVISKI